jgi:hypothetical protein
MPFALLAIGLLLVITAYNNTQEVLSRQLKADFSGNTGFIYWIAAIVIVGSIGYIRPLQSVSRAFLALILIVIFLTNSGVFSKFNQALAGAAQSGDATTGAGDGTATGAGNVAGERAPLEITVRPQGVPLQ